MWISPSSDTRIDNNNKCGDKFVSENKIVPMALFTVTSYAVQLDNRKNRPNEVLKIAMKVYRKALDFRFLI